MYSKLQNETDDGEVRGCLGRMMACIERHVEMVFVVFYWGLVIASLVGSIYLESIEHPDCSTHVVAVINSTLALDIICVTLLALFFVLVRRYRNKDNEETSGVLSSESNKKGESVWLSLTHSVLSVFFIGHGILWGCVLFIRHNEVLCQDSPFFQNVVDYSIVVGYVLVSLLAIGGLLFLAAIVLFVIESSRKKLADQTTVQEA